MARLAALPTVSREMVEVMACLGGRAEWSVLATATAESADVVEQRLAPALEEGVLVAETGARDAVRFRHDRIREAVLAELAAERRASLQLALARRLAAAPELFAVAAEQYLPVIDALTDAAERAQLVALLRRAAEQATLVGGYSQVHTLLTGALRVADAGDTGTLIELHTGPPRRPVLSGAAGGGRRRLPRHRDAEHLRDPAGGRDLRAGAQPDQPQALHRGHRACRRRAGRAGHFTVPAPERLPELLERYFDYLYRWLDHTDDTDDLGPARNHRPDPARRDVSPQRGLSDRDLRRRHLHAGVAEPGGGADFARPRHRPRNALAPQAIPRSPPSRCATTTTPHTGRRAGSWRWPKPAAMSPRRHWRGLWSLTSVAGSSRWKVSVEQAKQAREGLIKGGDLATAGYTVAHTYGALLDFVPTLDVYAAEAEQALAFVRRVGIEPMGQWLETYRWLAGVLRGEDPRRIR